MKFVKLFTLVTAYVVSFAAQAVVIGPVSGSWDGSEATQQDRLERDGIASACTPAKAFPGTWIAGTQLYETFAFVNNGGEDCITVDVTVSSTDTHVAAYLGAYDPTNFATNYLGDLGSSESQPFGFTVPALSEFVIVAFTNFGAAPANGESFSFTVEGDNVSRVAAQVPEPATLALIGAGLLGFGARKRLQVS